jgi:phosphoribosylamine--glycine ligase
MNVLVVGGGAREHVVSEAISRSTYDINLYATMANKNPGIDRLCEDFILLGDTEIDKMVDYALRKRIEVAIIGPEKPLSLGISDALEDAGVYSIGPKSALARIEYDKAWARDLMRRYHIDGCPKFGVFDDFTNACEFIDEVGEVAVKPAGLTGGKGVRVVGDQLKGNDEAKEYARDLLKRERVVIEEKMGGEEFTIQAFVDGKTLSTFQAVQDHKRAYEGDIGPNTGGMGSYSDASLVLPFMTISDYEKAVDIMKKTISSLKEETDRTYKGVLYGQFMLTADGVKLTEYNARFGDPEAMNVLPLLRTDIMEIMDGIIDGSLKEMDYELMATVCKYAVPKGYPENPLVGRKIEVGEIDGALLFYASVNEDAGGIYTTSSRSLAVVGIGERIAEAEVVAENALSKIRGEIHCRHDIGTQELIERRIAHARTVRG